MMNLITVAFGTCGLKMLLVVLHLLVSRKHDETGVPCLLQGYPLFMMFRTSIKRSHVVLQFTFLQDDVGIPANYRHMEGFGVHTYTLINKEGKVSYVKFHWQPTCGALLHLLH